MFSFEVTQSITILATAISEIVTDEQAALLAAAFTQLGDTLATIAVANALCDSKENPAFEKQIDEDITLN